MSTKLNWLNHIEIVNGTFYDMKNSCRNTDTSHPPFDQMTIFYSGRVNVYDGVLVDKVIIHMFIASIDISMPLLICVAAEQARAIMHLAASPIQFSQDEQNTGNSSRWSSPCQLPTSSRKYNVSTQDGSAAQPMLQGEPLSYFQSLPSSISYSGVMSEFSHVGGLLFVTISWRICQCSVNLMNLHMSSCFLL